MAGSIEAFNGLVNPNLWESRFKSGSVVDVKTIDLGVKDVMFWRASAGESALKFRCISFPDIFEPFGVWIWETCLKSEWNFLQGSAELKILRHK